MGIEPESIKFSQSLSLKLEQQLAHYTQQAIQAIRA